ncbi:MAG: hypothetical protein V7727_21295, partial [Sneathiella sp.]
QGEKKMNQYIEEHRERHRKKFRELRPIFEKHFPTVDEGRIPGLVQLFMAEKNLLVRELELKT